MTDILVANHGSIFILSGASPAGRNWLFENVIEGNDEVQLWGPVDEPGVVVEPRYVEAIISGAVNDGLEVA